MCGRLQEAHVSLHTTENELVKYRMDEKIIAEKTRELESQLALEIAQRQSIAVSLRELESRLKSEVQEAKEAADLAANQADQKLAKARSEADELMQKLVNAEKQSNKKSKTSKLVRGGPSSTELTDRGTENIEIKTRTSILSTNPMPEMLPTGETSFVAAERVGQQVQQKVEDSRAQLFMLQQLQVILSTSSVLILRAQY